MSVEVIQGDSLTVLRTLPDESAQTCVTSPPYFGLRSYNGGDAEIGTERTPDEYVAKLVEVFREVQRVLHRSGTLWIVIGDSYAGSGRSPTGATAAIDHTARQGFHSPAVTIPVGLKPKDLCGVPWMLAFALRSDGWYLRSDIIWAKPNPMPESVQDRPTRAHEYLFLLAKSERYYYDAASIRDPLKESSLARISQATFDQQTGGPKDYAATGENPNRSMRKALVNVRDRADKQRGHGRRHAGFNDRWDQMTHAEQVAGGANKRSVWTVPTRPYPLAHFATFPEALVEPCVLAGCPEGGTVLDPFAGSGTTLAVALRLGRSAIGIELNGDYVKLIHKRLSGVTLPLRFGEDTA